MEWLWALRWAVGPLVVLSLLWLGIEARRRRMTRLHALWGWLGPAERVHGAGVRWTGTVAGRSVRVQWVDRNLVAEVEARPAASVGYGRTDQPASLVKASEQGPGWRFGPWMAYGEDRLARELPHRPGAPQALAVLLEPGDGSLRAVDLAPDRGVRWLARRLPRRGLTSEQTRRWVDALIALARTSEADERRVGPS